MLKEPSLATLQLSMLYLSVTTNVLLGKGEMYQIVYSYGRVYSMLLHLLLGRSAFGSLWRRRMPFFTDADDDAAD